MSTRWYPIYQKGGPQLRVFLSNFWIKLVKPTEEQPPNVVQFSVSPEMSKYDIKSYLEKIYDIKPVEVRTRIEAGKTRKDPGRGYVVKGDDIKYAYITLQKGETFEFPNLFPNAEKEAEDHKKALKETKEGYKRFLEKSKNRPGLPGWLSV